MTKETFIPPPPFAARLQEGERLLWQGRPYAARFNRPRVIAYAFVLLPCLPVLVWAAAYKLGASLPLLSPLTFAIALGLWPVACWAVSLYMGGQTGWAAYALTDRRVMIRRLERLTSKNSRPKIEEYPLGSLRPRLSQAGGEFGTITLGFPAWHYEQAFRAIPEASSVFALLMEARASLAPPGTETPYYLDKKPAAASPPPLEAYLQRGEKVLWQGGMDARTYWRTQCAAVVVLLLMIPAAIGTFLAVSGWWTPLFQALAVVPALALFPVWRANVMRTAARSAYVLTNRRVLVLKTVRGGRRTLEERSLTETAGMRLVSGKNGFGTIIFEKMTHWVWHGQGGSRETYEYSFKHVPDARGVFEAVTAARARMRGGLQEAGGAGDFI